MDKDIFDSIVVQFCNLIEHRGCNLQSNHISFINDHNKIKVSKCKKIIFKAVFGLQSNKKRNSTLSQIDRRSIIFFQFRHLFILLK